MMRFWLGVALLCSLAVGCGETIPEEPPPEESPPEEPPPEKSLPEAPDREGPAAEDVSAQWKRPRLELGTAYLVKDLFPPDPFPSGPLGVFKPTHLVDFQGTLYFLANFNFDFEPNPAKGELWKSDGTPEGTVPVREFRGVGELMAVGDKLFLTASDEAVGSGLWVSDGTAEGTRFILDIPPAPSDPGPLELTAVGDTLFFFLGNELWRSDGTPEGTVLVEDLGPGTRNPYSHFEKAVLGDDRLLFTFVSPEHGEELWVSDGTAEGTRLLRDIYPGATGSIPSHLTLAEDGVYFSALSPEYGEELWRTDGTREGTRLIEDTVRGPEGSDARPLAYFKRRLYFATRELEDGGLRLRKVKVGGDCRRRSTRIADLPNMYPEVDIPQAWAATATERKLFFVIIYGGPGPAPLDVQLWRTDGTRRGTKLLHRPLLASPDVPVPPPTPLGDGRVVFAAEDPSPPFTFNQEPWVSDGTRRGTRKLQEIAPGDASSFPHQFTRSGDFLFFVANDQVHEHELWAFPLAGR